MVEWLEREEGEEEPSDLEVWHLQKSSYTFKDLGIWKKDGTLDKEYQKRLKEKAKAKARQNERNEKNRKMYNDSGDDSGDEAESSKKGRKGKKPVGKNKKSVPRSSKSRK